MITSEMCSGIRATVAAFLVEHPATSHAAAAKATGAGVVTVRSVRAAMEKRGELQVTPIRMSTCGRRARRGPGPAVRNSEMDVRDREIVRRAEEGETYSAIGKDLGLSRNRIGQIAAENGLRCRFIPKNGRRVDPFGYVHVKRHGHPRAVYGYVREHILVAEAKLGRHLLPGEVCHHINGKKDDNRAENIEVMSQAEHDALHRRMRGYRR